MEGQKNRRFWFLQFRWAASVINNVLVKYFLSSFLSGGSYIISFWCLSGHTLFFPPTLLLFSCSRFLSFLCVTLSTFKPSSFRNSFFLFMWLTAAQTPFHVDYSFFFLMLSVLMKLSSLPASAAWRRLSHSPLLLWWNFSLPTVRQSRPVTNS